MSNPFAVSIENTTGEDLAWMRNSAHESPTGGSRRRKEAAAAGVLGDRPSNLSGYDGCEKSAPSPLGWVFYDGECRFCVLGATRWGGLFARHGFVWLPLQTPGTSERLGMGGAALHEEMKLLHADGRIVGGVAAWAVLFRSVWWLWPFGALLGLPGVRWLGGVGYRWVARNRYCLGGHCEVSSPPPADHTHNPPRHRAFFELP
ncbi:MAG: DUF393 domain-containing protein [Verrucomicrobiota bacterium]